MKTKKISWQAIAIVFLALVLIASIALGVSGAWFQDRDDASSQAKFADSVTVRLKDPDTSKDPVSWAQYYKTNLASTSRRLCYWSNYCLPWFNNTNTFEIQCFG